MSDELYFRFKRRQTWTIPVGFNNEFPAEGFCWTRSDDPIEDACAFRVIFGVPTWSYSVTT